MLKPIALLLCIVVAASASPSCLLQDGNGRTYDLSGIDTQPNGQPWSYRDEILGEVLFHVCSPLSNGTCNESGDTQLCQHTLHGGTYSLGASHTQKVIQLMTPDNLALGYTQGTVCQPQGAGRKTALLIVCHLGMGKHEAYIESVAESATKPCRYNIVMASGATCQ
jgi:hypothetical protein